MMERFGGWLVVFHPEEVGAEEAKGGEEGKKERRRGGGMKEYLCCGTVNEWAEETMDCLIRK
jgi:hypothetical protein